MFNGQLTNARIVEDPNIAEVSERLLLDMCEHGALLSWL